MTRYAALVLAGHLIAGCEGRLPAWCQGAATRLSECTDANFDATASDLLDTGSVPLDREVGPDVAATAPTDTSGPFDADVSAPIDADVSAPTDTDAGHTMDAEVTRPDVPPDAPDDLADISAPIDADVSAPTDTDAGLAMDVEATRPDLPFDAPDDLPRVVSIAAGLAHSCALASDGTVWCWGSNGCGQFGDGSDAGRMVARPVRLEDGGVLRDVREVVAGERSTCARLEGGEVLCWGNSEVLEVIGDRGSATPRRVPLDGGATSLALGLRHACVVIDGGVVCWGYNTDQMAGAGGLVRTPWPVEGVSGVASVAAGERHSCVLTGSGGVLCWGGDIEGQLGDGTADATGRAAPVSVLLPRDDGGGVRQATDLAAGVYHNCVVLDGDHSVWCWGAGGNGRLAPGTSGANPLPLRVPSLERVERVTAGREHTCALSGGNVSCWGEHRGPWSPNDAGLTVVDVGAPLLSVAAGVVHTCVLTGSRRVLCWGLLQSDLGCGVSPEGLPSGPTEIEFQR